MTNAPERIWIEDEFGEGDDDQWTYGTWDVRNYAGYNVEYVRADIVQALTAERDKYEGAWMTAEGKLADTEAARDRFRKLLDAIVDEYNGQMHGPALSSVEAARAELEPKDMTTNLTEDLDRIATMTKGAELQWPYVADVAVKASASIKGLEAEITRLRAKVRFLERKIVS